MTGARLPPRFFRRKEVSVESILDKLTRELGHRGGIHSTSKEVSPGDTEGSWRDWRWWVNRVYRVICFGVGIVLLEISLLKLDFSILKIASPFVLLNIAAVLHAVTFPRSRRISFHFIITYANLLLFGPSVAALGSGLGAVGYYLLVRKKPLSMAMFQMGRYILAAMGAGFTFAVLGGRWGAVTLTWASVVLSVAAYLAIGLVLELLPLLWLRKYSSQTIWSSFVFRLLAHIIFVPTSISIFYIYLPYGSDGIFLFLIPVATFALALELYARRTLTNLNLTLVQEISKRLNTILEPDQLIREVLELIGRVIPFLWGVVWLENPRTGQLEARQIVSHTGEEWPAPAKPPPVVADAAQTGRSLQSAVPSPGYVSVLEGSSPLLELAVPLSSRGEVLGVLSLGTAVSGGYTSRERRLLEVLAGNVAIAIQNAELYTQTQKLAIRDGLTHLYNHRYLQQRLTHEEQRAKRYHRTFSFVLLDIDNFKVYNDMFGHPSGDKLLIDLARILESSVRSVDFVARYGGEEFAIVLPECDKERALLVAERIRKNVEEFSNSHREHYNLTISAGVSCYPADGDNKEVLLDKADKALYKAKGEGKNRVCQ
jgi:diguanylate cyclase (GGDEF)-like protein